MLRIEGLGVRMGIQQILSDVNLVVPERGVITVLGANGVGKTTLMRAISGVYRADSGSIHFADELISNLAPHKIVAKGLAQAPEGRQIFSNMSVRENLVLGFGANARSQFDATLQSVLQHFPILAQRINQQAGSLSGGEQQMLCIGRALMSRPRLLLLDEPSLGLAPKIVQQIFELIARIREAGTAILLVEQNVRGALKVADHAYVMESGRFVLSGAATQLREDPRVRDAYLGGAGQAVPLA
ncbi:MAG: ABC transporter ATP-binding protein [Burkholderiaceae bacterium]